MMKRGIGAFLAGGAVVAALAILAACTGSRGVPVEAPVELVIAPIGKLADAGIRTTGGQTDGACALALSAGRIQKSSRGCYLEDDISEASGILHYPCNGNGPADAEFGDLRYVGRMSDGELEVELVGELDWEDGCRWGTRASINGSVTRGDGELVLEKLAWMYADYVMSGSGCSGACTAKTSIDVADFKATKRRPRGDLDHEDEDEDEDN